MAVRWLWASSHSTDYTTPGNWQGNHKRTNFQVTGMTKRLNTEQSGNQGEGSDQGDDQVEDGKTT